MIESLQIFYSDQNNISNEDIEFLNKINPKILKIEGDIWTVENIKALALINCINIDINFSGYSLMACFYLWFIKTPIQLFDSKSDQGLTFEWESIKFFIEKNKIEKIILFKENSGNFLFLPLDIIWRILCSKFREIWSAHDTNKQFADLGVEHQFRDDGLIIPMGYSNKIFIELGDSELELFNQFKDINQVFKEKHFELKIWNLGRLLEINKLLPNHFCHINFEYFDDRSEDMKEYSESEIIDNPDWVNLKFVHIFQLNKLSPHEFQFWWKVLGSSKTRFNLTSIHLNFNSLSECLTVLSLCSGCPELKYIDLRYWEADAENEDEVVEQAKKEFRQNFWFIQNLDICKYSKF